MNERKCKVNECSEQPRAKGYCNPHYKRWVRHGDPEAGRRARGSNQGCEIEGCTNKAQARGWCGKHYMRWRTHGDPEYEAPKKEPTPCAVEGCGIEVRTRGYCNRHYLRLLRHGDPEGGGPAIYNSSEESFSARTEWRGDCLIWTGAKTSAGYGSLVTPGGKKSSHVYSWERTNGPVPKGMFVDHKDHCNKTCVNPDHLRLATPSQNAANLKGLDKNNTTGFRNVYFYANRYYVKVEKDGKRYSFGGYDTAEEAGKIAEEARDRLHGEYAGRG